MYHYHIRPQSYKDSCGNWQLTIWLTYIPQEEDSNNDQQNCLVKDGKIWTRG